MYNPGDSNLSSHQESARALLENCNNIAANLAQYNTAMVLRQYKLHLLQYCSNI
jgi:hypothetical protein